MEGMVLTRGSLLRESFMYMVKAWPMSRNWAAQAVRLLAARARDKVGSRMPIKSPMIPTTTSNSTKLKARSMRMGSSFIIIT